jgi:hypothetical protein
MTEDARLLDFYEGKAPDHRGRMLADIQRFSHDTLEHEHDFIQWLFPLRTPSPVNPEAPTVSDRDVERFRTSAGLAARLRRSFEVMLDFYGLEIVEGNDGNGVLRIDRSAGFQGRAANWLRPGNHNFLRITRILTAMTILGHETLARAFLAALEGVYAEYRDVIGERTWSFWRRAPET